MRVNVFGAGYVGLVSALCFAELGHQVVCVDLNAEKIKQLQAQQLPLHEDGLQMLLDRYGNTDRIQFTGALTPTQYDADIQLIAVGTPAKADGSVDLSYVDAVAHHIANIMTMPCVVVNKSTVPVGTAARVDRIIAQQRDGKTPIQYAVVSNPEFLAEGRAMHDFMQPDRIIIGSDDPWATAQLRTLYQPLINQGVSVLEMNPVSAELSKYAANTFLAARVALINEVASLAEQVGADIEQVSQGIGSDPRIGAHFLRAGCGFGGSCFPKDVLGLQDMLEQHELPAIVTQAITEQNRYQQNRFFTMIYRHFAGELAGKTIALWGLAFKPNTDDIRCASSLVLIDRLLASGASVQAYDPAASSMVRAHYGDQPQVLIKDSRKAALADADALAIVTEWSEFRDANLQDIFDDLQDPVVFDGRNLYQPAIMKQKGIAYYSIGRTPMLTTAASVSA